MLKARRKHAWKMLTAATLILALMTSCGNASATKSADRYDGAYTDSYSINREKGAYEEEAFDLAEESITENSASIDSKRMSGDKTSAEFEDKIIRTANIVMDSSDAQKCYDTLVDFAKQNGGREISVSKSTDTYGSYDYINIEAELKISPDKLDDFIALAEKTDKVTSSEISSDDVTREYYDVKLRLESKKEALKNYYKLLSEAKTIQESLEVQRYITDLTAEIESMEGTLKYYDSRVDLSTVYLNIRQRDKNAEEIEDFHWDSLSFGDFCKLMKNGFLSVLNFLWSLLLWIIIAVVVLSPVLLIAGGVFFLIRRYRKKHPKAPKAPKTAAPYAVPTYAVPQQTVSDPCAAKDKDNTEKK